jgi:hypothetical protein
VLGLARQRGVCQEPERAQPVVCAVTKDGQRFLISAILPKSSGEAALTVVLNWTASIHR